MQGNGVYESALPLFGGMHIWKAGPVIVDALRDAGRLLASSTWSTATRIAGATRRR